MCKVNYVQPVVLNRVVVKRDATNGDDLRIRAAGEMKRDGGAVREKGVRFQRGGISCGSELKAT